jgi:capsular exopolysaccharide synthesis family protein
MAHENQAGSHNTRAGNVARTENSTDIVPAEDLSAGPEQGSLARAGTHSAYYATGSDEIELRYYLEIIARRCWTVIASLVICVLTAVIISMAATPLYTATALIQVRPGGSSVTDFDAVQETATQAQAYNDYFQTQYRILESRALATRTISTLNLNENPEFNDRLKEPGVVSRAKYWIRGFVGGDDPDAKMVARQEKAELIDRFLDSIEVRPQRKSFLVEVAFTSPDPELAQQVADSLTSEYVDLTLDQSVAATTQARGFIQKQVGKIKAELEASEQELQAFARGQDIIALEQEEAVIHDRLADLNQRVTDAEARRIEAEALYNQSTEPDASVLSFIVANPLLKTLREAYAGAAAERAELGTRFTDAFPPVLVVDSKLGALADAIVLEEGRLIEAIRTDYERMFEREGALRDQLDRQRTIVANYEHKAIDFKIHRREVDTNREIYESLLRRMKEVEVTEAIRASNITVVDPPEVPLEPSSPNLPLNMALSLVLGLFSGFGLAFIQEFVDDSFQTPDDVERHLRLPTLGTVPEFTRVAGETDDAASTADLEVSLQPTSAGSEAIRTLRASLSLAAAGGFPERLLLTSARPGEGKTCIAVNLVVALGQMGRRVCLIDCDLRRPRVNKALAISLSPGLTNYLTKNDSLDAVIRPTGEVGVDVITAGPIPPNPVDLLNSGAMSDLLAALGERYDHILVDAPPAMGFADVPILTNQLGGGCLLITRAGTTSRRQVRHAVEYLIRMQSKLLGVVLNRVSTRGSGYSYYGYYGSYGDYYSSAAEDERLGPLSDGKRTEAA